MGIDLHEVRFAKILQIEEVFKISSSKMLFYPCQPWLGSLPRIILMERVAESDLRTFKY